MGLTVIPRTFLLSRSLEALGFRHDRLVGAKRTRKGQNRGGKIRSAVGKGLLTGMGGGREGDLVRFWVKHGSRRGSPFKYR